MPLVVNFDIQDDQWFIELVARQIQLRNDGRRRFFHVLRLEGTQGSRQEPKALALLQTRFG